MRKIVWFLTLLLILTAVPHGAAFASAEPLGQQPQEEVVVGKFIFEGYWDVWGAKSKWVSTAHPGQKNLSVDSDVVYPSGWAEGSRGLKDLLRRYELTRAEVKYVYPFGEAEYNDAGRRYDKPWGGPFKPGFYTEDYACMPDNPRAVIKSFDPKTGATVVKWTIDYPAKPNPGDPTSAPKGPKGNAASIKNWLVNGEWDKIDLRFASKTDLDKIRANKALEGWRVYFPAIVWWYGIERPDLAADIAQDKYTAKPGETVTSTVTFTASNASVGPQDAVISLQYEIGGKTYPVTLEPLNPADKPSPDGKVTFQPGDKKTYRFSVTAGQTTSKLIAKINPVLGVDADWTNNRDEALIVPRAVDIAVDVKFPKDSCFIVPWNGSVYPSATINVRRKDPGTEPIKVRLTMSGPKGPETKEFELAGGKVKSFSYGVTMSKAGSVTVTAEAWPVGMQDANPKDNVGSDTACFVKRDPPITGPKEPGLHGELRSL